MAITHGKVNISSASAVMITQLIYAQQVHGAPDPSVPPRAEFGG